MFRSFRAPCCVSVIVSVASLAGFHTCARAAEPIGRFGGGVFYEAESGPGAEFDFELRNLFGSGFEAGAGFSTTQRARYGSLSASTALGTHGDIEVKLSGSRANRVGVSFEQSGYGLEIRRGHSLSPEFRFSTRIRQMHTRIERLNTDQPTLLDEANAGWQLDRSIGYALDFRSSQLAYGAYSWLTAGIYQDISGFGGDRHYLTSRANLTLRRGLIGGWLRARADFEFGLVHTLSGSSRISERFRLGDHMRGFGPFGAGPRDVMSSGRDSMGGNYLAVGRFSAEVPLTGAPDSRFFGGVFLDAGSVWGLDTAHAADGGAIDDKYHWRVTTGVNLGWYTDVGRLNLTIADALVKRDGDRVMNISVSLSNKF